MSHRRLSFRRNLVVLAAGLVVSASGAASGTQCVPKPPHLFATPTVAELATSAAGDKLVVSGRVVSADCRPLAGAVVQLWNTDSKVGASATTDADGRFEVTTAVSRGRIHIRISHNGRILTAGRTLAAARLG